MKNRKIAVVTGVTSGIGKEVALGLIKQNYELHVIARNQDKFNILQELATKVDKNASLTLLNLLITLNSLKRLQKTVFIKG